MPLTTPGGNKPPHICIIHTPPYDMKDVFNWCVDNNIKISSGFFPDHSLHDDVIANWRFYPKIKRMVIECFCVSDEIAILLALNFSKKENY